LEFAFSPLTRRHRRLQSEGSHTLCEALDAPLWLNVSIVRITYNLYRNTGRKMPLPVQSIRATPEHRAILQAVADMLRRGEESAVLHMLSDLSTRSVGPFRNEEAAIAFLRDRLVTDLHPRMVWLFGSRGRGDNRPDSDFDLLVVMPDGLPSKDYHPRAVAAPISACGLGVDVVPCSMSDFRENKENPETLIGRAAMEGKLLYQDRVCRGQADAAQ
jgi:predicted nucleotidyltransferase